MKKETRERLLELFRESNEPNFLNFLDSLEEDGVILAEKIFEEKKRQDKWWKEALERNNKLRGSENNDE